MEEISTLIFQLSIVIIATAVLCVIFELAKQPLLVAFIFSGLLIGPQGFGLIENNEFFEAIGQIGIILLLYLIGLELKTRFFGQTFTKASIVTLAASIVLFMSGFWIAILNKLSVIDAFYIAMAFIFSSTVVVVKLLNDEQKKNGNIIVRQFCIASLILQDIIAIILLLFISSQKEFGYLGFFGSVQFLLQGIGIFALAFLFQKYFLKKIAKRIMHKPDIMFLLGLAWCFMFAELAEFFHLTREIGAFIAGLSLTFLPSYKLSIIVKKSETIRDFFMILFFFVIGAKLQFDLIKPFGALIAISLIFIIVVKPIIFKLAYWFFNMVPRESFEISVRLGQLSEFSVIVAMLALGAGHISESIAMVIHVIMFLSIIFSTYLVEYIPFKKLMPQEREPAKQKAKVKRKTA
jgi:Kef-type K+ transport system membrane component KefB